MEPIFPENKPPVNNWSTLVNALCAAAWVGGQALVRQLLDKGADPNVEDGYFRPHLQQAARNGHYDVVLLLLEEGANINLGYSRPKDSYGKGALVFASHYGHEKVVKLFLSPKFGFYPRTSIRDSALRLAIEGGHQHIIEMLMVAPEVKEDLSIAKNGALMLTHSVSSSRQGIIRWLLGSDGGVNNNELRNIITASELLHIAARRGRTSIVRLLLDYGANRYGPALLGAARNGHIEVAKLLLDTPVEGIDALAMAKGEPPFVDTDVTHTPIYWASKNGHQRMGILQWSSYF
jgi:ankyrin repeat protein